MDKNTFEKSICEFVIKQPGNFVQKEIALRPELGGMQIFDEPLVAYVSADDEIFAEFKKPGVIGAHFMAPLEWLVGAKTMIALFLPFTARVREANSRDMDWPADEWLHARIEGHAHQVEICRFITELLNRESFSSISPMNDPRLKSGNPLVADKTKQESYSSNWSERHAAYAAGLGTFGLHKGLITRKGCAGRYISVITSAPFEPDARSYSGVYDYCINCGACVRNCPVKAITIEGGKLHHPCSVMLDSTREKHNPRYGCGKCQVKVPCESKAPGIKK